MCPHISVILTLYVSLQLLYRFTSYVSTHQPASYIRQHTSIYFMIRQDTSSCYHMCPPTILKRCTSAHRRVSIGQQMSLRSRGYIAATCPHATSLRRRMASRSASFSGAKTDPGVCGILASRAGLVLASTCIRQHTLRQHASGMAAARAGLVLAARTSFAYIRQHTSAYVSGPSCSHLICRIRFVRMRIREFARHHLVILAVEARVSIRQHTLAVEARVSIRQHASAYTSAAPPGRGRSPCRACIAGLACSQHTWPLR